MRKLKITLLILAIPVFLQATVIPICGGGSNVENNAEDGIELSGQCGVLNTAIGTVSGNIVLSSGSTLTLNQHIALVTGNIEICSDCTLIINGNIDQVNGSIVNSGNLTISGIIEANGALETKGTATTTLAGGSFTSSGSSVNVESGGMLLLKNGAGISAPSSGVSNEGTIDSDGLGNSVEGGITGTGTTPVELLCADPVCIDVSNMPVDLLSFTANCEEEQIRFVWETTSEQNNDFFSLEASLDGENWESIAKIAGAGTTTEYQLYEYLEPKTGAATYYRLKQQDFDGTNVTFEVLAPACVSDAAGKVQLFPNPSAGEVEIRLDQWYEQINVTVFDLNGRQLSQQQFVGQSRLHLQLPEQKGIYCIKVSGSNLPDMIKRVVRQ